MIRQLFRYPPKFLKYDLTSGLVVFLVAIPLCLGVALASGAPLFSGIISGFIGGIVVGIISESKVSVSGPAAGMVAVVLGAITALGSFDVFLLALVFAGVIQIIVGAMRAGFIADYVPSNVIQGLLCAIGILIIIKQLPFAFTYTADNESLLHSLRVASEMFSIKPLSDIAQHINLGATIISVISVALLIFFDKTTQATLKTIPGPVVVVVMSVVINELFAAFWPSIAQYSNELVNIPVNGGVSSFVNQFMHPAWSEWANPNVYVYAFVLASVASLEALLNLEAIEKLDNVRRYVSRNRELVAQGIGNSLSGLIGGIPITSVIVRSSVNIQAGAKTKVSTIVHGFLILFVAIFIPHWINLIPLASLATILIYVGFKLTTPRIYKKMYNQGMSRFIPFIITIIAIISTNLLTGVLIGLFFSFFFILRDNSKIKFDIINEKLPAGEVKRILLPQHMSFLSKASLVSELDQIPQNTHLIIDARYTKYIDRDILEVINTFQRNQAPSKNIALNLLGFKEQYEIENHADFLNVTTYDAQSALSPMDVLEILKEGNKRFVVDRRIHRSLLDDIKATSSNQHPVAIVLGCIDSRVPVETIFDMGVGDLFVVRVAGNVINDDIIASMVFACHNAGAKLIVVLGHTFCGAIKAACDNGASGELGQLLKKIKPAVDAEKQIKNNRDGNNVNFVTNVTRINIDNSLQTIYSTSPVLNQMINAHEIGLIGALYDLSSGEVHFQDHFYGGKQANYIQKSLNMDDKPHSS